MLIIAHAPQSRTHTNTNTKDTQPHTNKLTQTHKTHGNTNTNTNTANLCTAAVTDVTAATSQTISRTLIHIWGLTRGLMTGRAWLGPPTAAEGNSFSVYKSQTFCCVLFLLKGAQTHWRVCIWHVVEIVESGSCNCPNNPNNPNNPKMQWQIAVVRPHVVVGHSDTYVLQNNTDNPACTHTAMLEAGICKSIKAIESNRTPKAPFGT